MKNPCKIFLEWNSIEQTFSFYDKDKGKDIFITKPIVFYPFATYHVIKGFSTEHQRSICSNEISSIKKDILNVYTFAKDETGNYITLYKGNYNKEAIEALGGRYMLSIYAISSNGTLVNFSLQGEQISSFLALRNNDIGMLNNWVSMNDTLKRTYVNPDTGKSSNYYIPKFESLNHDAPIDIKEKVEKIKEQFRYMKVYLENNKKELKEVF